MRYTADIPKIPPISVENCNCSDKNIIAKPIAVIGTRNIYALACFGPNSVDARKYIDVPKDIAINERIRRFNQNIQSNSNTNSRFSLYAIVKLKINAKVKLQKL